MKKTVPLVLAIVLVACSKATSVDTVESLMTNPDRLRAVEQKCESNDSSISPNECRIASEARHKLFMGNGPQYTPPKTTPNS